MTEIDHSAALAVLRGHDIDPTNQADIDAVAKKVFDLPQASAPVEHFWGPGVYIRQVSFPAGVFAVGHKQRNEHLNVFLKGRVAMIGKDGAINELAAPMIFTGQPGQKMGYILEDVVWQNIYSNPDNERDIDILETRHLDKNGPWTEREATEAPKRQAARAADREDYHAMLKTYGHTEAEVRRQSEYESDQTPMPPGYDNVITIRNSDIEGRGVFASYPFPAGKLIGPATFAGKRTPIGRYTNHASSPNATFIRAHNGDILLVSTSSISGCMGGGQGEEITIDYRDAIKMRVEGGPCHQR